jgi:uncharacterized protein YprB with RNaseH-like and TPR domain
MYIYIHMHACRHPKINTNKQTNACAYMCKVTEQMDTDFSCAEAGTCVHTKIHRHECIAACMLIQIDANTHTHVDACIHTSLHVPLCST